MGGVFDFFFISFLLGFELGFVGCLSYLVIDGKVVKLSKFFFFILIFYLSIFNFYLNGV